MLVYIGPDHLKHANAEKLAQRLTEYWAKLGYNDVTTTTIVEVAAKTPDRVVYGVRSNLIDGLPPSLYEQVKLGGTIPADIVPIGCPPWRRWMR